MFIPMSLLITLYLVFGSPLKDLEALFALLGLAVLPIKALSRALGNVNWRRAHTIALVVILGGSWLYIASQWQFNSSPKRPKVTAATYEHSIFDER